MTKSTMKAITIHQPYAQLIADGHKRYETRHWTTSYRGPIAIHAGKKWDRHLTREAESLIKRFPDLPSYLQTGFHFGKILVACKLVAIHPVEDIRDSLSPLERAVGNYADGRYAWELEIIKHPEKPIPARGQQGIWTWEYTPEPTS